MNGALTVPVIALAGVNREAMAAATIGLLFDLPDAAVVRHDIDVERQELTRTVSDMSGVVEEHVIGLEHACVSCAIREDIVPTLERLARAGRWQSIVAHLPVGAEPRQLCAVAARDTRLARLFRISAVLVAVGTAHPVRDLLGDDLLVERGVHSSHEDRRGVGEVLCAMIEYADTVVFDGAVDPCARGLAATLARPGVPVVEGASGLSAGRLVGRLHQYAGTESWVSPNRPAPLPLVDVEGIWQVDLRSPLPFHPERLLESLEQLGGGVHRSRGCLWLPSRPRTVVEWDGAGGQLSIGEHGSWGRVAPFTRIVLTGVGVAPQHLRSAFAHLLARPEDVAGRRWHVAEDGFEPWLGPIREVA